MKRSLAPPPPPERVREGVWEVREYFCTGGTKQPPPPLPNKRLSPCPELYTANIYIKSLISNIFANSLDYKENYQCYPSFLPMHNKYFLKILRILKFVTRDTGRSKKSQTSSAKAWRDFHFKGRHMEISAPPLSHEQSWPSDKMKYVNKIPIIFYLNLYQGFYTYINSVTSCLYFGD